MKVAVMQPYFFPYVGYFQLMACVDQWIVFDQSQFIDKGWINRNRILHPDASKEWQFITLPLKKRGQFDRICDIELAETVKWRQQILGKLTSYKKKAPNYKTTLDLVQSCLSCESKNLSEFVVSSMKSVATALDIQTPVRLQSQLQRGPTSVEHRGQWALKVSQAVGADEYINPYSGFRIFNEKEFNDAGIKLAFLKPKSIRYSQRRELFVPRLSIIDLMMWNSIEMVKEIVENEFEVLTYQALADLSDSA